MQEIRFTIDVSPRSKKNSQQILTNRKTGRPFIMPSAAYKAYQKAALMLIPAEARQHIDRPVNVKATFYMPTRRACDIANLNSALHDILVDAGVIVDDNRDIVAGTDGSRVLYSKDHPRTEVIIEEMRGDYETWAKK